jgi:hypothetical protein
MTVPSEEPTPARSVQYSREAQRISGISSSLGEQRDHLVARTEAVLVVAVGRGAIPLHWIRRAVAGASRPCH